MAFSSALPLAASQSREPLRGTDEHCGWVLLLPAPDPGDRLLCIEWEASAYAHILATWYPAVTAIQHSEAHQPLRIVEYRNGVEFSRTSLAAPLDGNVLTPGFTGLIVRAATCGAGNLPGPGTLFGLIDRYRSRLADSAFAYVEFANRWSIGKLRPLLTARFGELRGGIGPATVRQGLARRGWNRAAMQPAIVERNRLVELIPDSGYSAERKGLTAGERLKERLLGRHLSQWFAPMFAALAPARTRRRSTGELLLASVAHLPELATATASAATTAFAWRQFNVSRGKCFIEFAAAGRGIFLVIPMRADMIERRRRELRIIETLRETHFGIANLLPGFTREVAFMGHPVFALATLEGRVVDARVHDLGSLTQAAAELMLDFNRESMREVRVGAAEFDALVGGALAGVASRYPSLQAMTERLRELLHGYLADRSIRAVWLHGDYKVENLVFDRLSARITGVLDWELGSPLGLPLLDVLYLLAYDCVTTGRAADLLDAIERNVLGADWNDAHRSILDNYRTTLALDDDAMKLAQVVFVVHHLGLRFSYDVADPQVRQRLTALLGQVLERAVSLSARAARA